MGWLRFNCWLGQRWGLGGRSLGRMRLGDRGADAGFAGVSFWGEVGVRLGGVALGAFAVFHAVVLLCLVVCAAAFHAELGVFIHTGTIPVKLRKRENFSLGMEPAVAAGFGERAVEQGLAVEVCHGVVLWLWDEQVLACIALDWGHGLAKRVAAAVPDVAQAYEFADSVAALATVELVKLLSRGVVNVAEAFDSGDGEARCQTRRLRVAAKLPFPDTEHAAYFIGRHPRARAVQIALDRRFQQLAFGCGLNDVLAVHDHASTGFSA